MPSLPIPLFAALVLAFLFLRLVVTGRAHTPLAWVLGLCAMQAIVISLAQHYGVPSARLVQPIKAELWWMSSQHFPMTEAMFASYNR